MTPDLIPVNNPEGDQAKEYHLPKQICVIPLKDLVVFPSMVVSVYVKNGALIEAVNKAMTDKELVGVVAQQNPLKPAPPLENLYKAGTAVAVLQVIKGTSNDAMVLIEGIHRFKVTKYLQEYPYIQADIHIIQKASGTSVESEAMLQDIKELIVKTSKGGKALPDELLMGINSLSDVEQLADLASSYLTLDVKKKQELLEIENIEERLRKIVEYLNKEIQVLAVRKQIHADINQEMNKSERDYILRQEMKAIKKELGEKEGTSMMGMEGLEDQTEIKDLQKRVTASKMPKEVEKIVNQELERLKKIFPFSPEYAVARTYIEWLCDMPWNKISTTRIDVKKARKILDEDHYGLEKIKERILEYLAVCQMNESKCGSTILCFVGPPGVGKTSLGRSIARALGRSFIHTSLGGIRDEADIRGHRRTYVGAMPGRIIQSIKRAGFKDPVFMLDEVDKIGHDFQGDPAAALIEALDPEQNFNFVDHYLDVPFDLSRVLFITTANFLDPVPPALLDRMEIIEIPGYTEEEKLQIAKRYLVPKQLTMNGLEKHPYTLHDDAIMDIIRHYTSEAGLRELEREIATICRKVAKDFLEKKKVTKEVTLKDIHHYLGVRKYEFEAKEEEDTVGVATGLAWTPTGGEIIFIEATKMSGNKNLILTGNLGAVMEESARAALSYLRSNAKNFGIAENAFDKYDIHVHVPEGATPKDGPSAGITMCTALVSLMTNRKVRRDVAMTGEITLTGRILPIGGLKEKILAAKRARIKTIIIPDRNRKDLEDIPKHLIKGLEIRPAKTLDDVMKVALLPTRTKVMAAPKPKMIKPARPSKKIAYKIIKVEGSSLKK
jgi:ATP-dependent Lon protease